MMRLLGMLGLMALATACSPATPSAVVPIVVGTTSNDVIEVQCGDDHHPLVVSSGDARVDVFADDAIGTDIGVGSNPWAATAVDGDGTRTVVTRYAAGDVALINACAGTMMTTTTMTDATTPQAIRSDGSDVFVLFTNIVRPATPNSAMELRPGVLGHFAVVGEVLEVRGRIALPCDNPSGLVVDSANSEMWISCSGPFAIGPSGNTVQQGEGVVMRLPWLDGVVGAPMVMVQEPNAFGPITIDSNSIVVGDLLDGAVRRYDRLGALLEEREVQAGGSIFIVTFINNQLWAGGFAPAEVVIDPFADDSRIRLDTAAAPRGLVALTARRDGGAWALLTLSSELVVVAP